MHKIVATVHTGSKPIGKTFAVAVLTVCACGVLLWVWSAFSRNTSSVRPLLSAGVSVDGPAISFDANRIDHFDPEDQIIFSLAKSDKVNQEAAAFQQFKNEIAVATQDLEDSSFEINSVVERLTSFKSCLTLTYLMAQDFFTGADEVGTLLIAEGENLDRITSSSVNRAKQAIDRLSEALTIVEGSYPETFIAGTGAVDIATGLSDNAFVNDTARRMSPLVTARTIASESSLGSASALLSSMAFAKSANRSLWSLLGATEKKLVRRVSAAAIPAVIDGPLPFGDMVALALESGCLIWSFHEVYHAQGALKSTLKHEFSGLLTQNSKQIHNWAMNVGNELMETAALSLPVPELP